MRADYLGAACPLCTRYRLLMEEQRTRIKCEKCGIEFRLTFAQRRRMRKRLTKNDEYQHHRWLKL